MFWKLQGLSNSNATEKEKYNKNKFEKVRQYNSLEKMYLNFMISFHVIGWKLLAEL